MSGGMRDIDRMNFAVMGYTQTDAYQYHDSLITPEQSAALNAAYNFEVVGAFHGFGEGAESRVSPEPEEYQVVADNVADLHGSSGDMLFVENVAHDNTYLVAPGTKINPAAMRSFAAEKLKSKTMDTFEHAAALALANEVIVMPADMHSSMVSHFAQNVGVVSYDDIHRHPRFNPIFHRMRNVQGVNTVKDVALDNLASAQQRPNKPTYRLLFGTRHVTGNGPFATIPSHYEALGLDAKVTVLPSAQLQRVSASLLEVSSAALFSFLGTQHGNNHST